MKLFEYQCELINESMILLLWPDVICQEQHQYIVACQKTIEQHFQEQLDACVVSFASLAIHVNVFKSNVTKIATELPSVLKAIKNSSSTDANLIEIPVYYGREAGWDIEDVAIRADVSIEELISIHSQETYYAYATGFTPGFSYLGEINQKIVLPRKASPRIKMPKGAVAIADKQTAVYPNASPGGWHILGQTPTTMYCLNDDGFAPLINVGDRVRFNAISLDEYKALGGEVSLES